MEIPAIPEGSEDPIERAMREHPGSWIAWNKERTIIVIADTYNEALQRVGDAGDAEPEINRAPGLHPNIASCPFALLEGESADIVEDVRKSIPFADEWLDTLNARLWCEKPRDLIGTSKEHHVRALLRSICSGCY